MKDKPYIFNSLLRAWTLARPIKTSFSDIKELFVGVKDLKKKVQEAKKTTLFSGGIYSIYSEKTKYGMGKSQFAYFLQREFENELKLKTTKYLSLSPSQEGFNRLKEELRVCLAECNESAPFYFFIDEIDLISEPNLSEEDIAKRIENFGNILIDVSEEAFTMDRQFYIFLVLSKRIQDDFEKLVSHRIKRRITPFIAVDILFTEEDIENLATRFFSMLWISNYKNIKERFENYDYRFKETIGNMITDFIKNLDYLGLDIKSSVIGDFVEKFRNIYEIVLDGVSETQVEELNLGYNSNVGIMIEDVFKEYLLSRNKPFVYEENGHQIKIVYIRENKKIGRHDTDGYYNFLIGDNQIGIMPVEITTQKDFEGRKKKQLKAFTENYNTLLIWMFPDKNKVNEKLNNLKEKGLKDVPNELYELLIPRDLIKYALMLEGRKFSFLEEMKENIMGVIHTYLTKYAKILFNRWMMEKPILSIGKGKGDDHGGVGGDGTVAITNIQKNVERLFENFFEVFDNADKKSHSVLKRKLKEELGSLNKGLKLDQDFLNIENIYREILEITKKNGYFRYNSPYTDRSCFMKEKKKYNAKGAVNMCTPIITSRIEAKIN